MKYYFDRRDAGRDLARALKGYAGRSRVIVLALSPGGVPVAWEIASALRAPRFTPSPPSPQAGVVTRIGGEHPKSVDAKVVTGLLVSVPGSGARRMSATETDSHRPRLLRILRETKDRF